MDTTKELVSPKVAARRLGVARGTVLRWIREGRIPAFRCGQRYIRLSWPQTLEALEREAAHEEEHRVQEVPNGR